MGGGGKKVWGIEDDGGLGGWRRVLVKGNKRNRSLVGVWWIEQEGVGGGGGWGVW